MQDELMLGLPLPLKRFQLMLKAFGLAQVVVQGSLALVRQELKFLQVNDRQVVLSSCSGRGAGVNTQGVLFTRYRCQQKVSIAASTASAVASTGRLA